MNLTLPDRRSIDFGRRFSFARKPDYHRAMNFIDNQNAAVPLVEVLRGSMVESVHRGVIAAIDASGRVIASLGDINTRTWYRSAAKPFQTIPLIASGAADHFNFTPQEIAVITASHSGESIHLEAVSSILQKIGLTEADLLCGAHMPFDEASAKQLRAAGRPPQVLHNNCSGKHSGMLAFAKFIGEPTANYIDPQHPIQRRIRDTLVWFAAVHPTAMNDPMDDEIAIAVDGCSAPVFGLSIATMARGYARLVAVRHTDIEPGLAAAAEQVVDSMMKFPEMIGGSHGRLDTDLMRTASGRIVSKVGAEGVQLLGVLPCAQYPKGLGIAIKIEDGDTRRARDPVVIETLRQLSLLDEYQLSQLSRYARSTVLNYRKIEVGEVRTCFKL
ncbi:MAG: asparaginase [Acidobacteriota bacterium]